MQNNSVSILCADVNLPLCRNLSQALNAPIYASKTNIQTPYILEITGDSLHLHVLNEPSFKTIFLDFNQTRMATGKDPLIKAIGRNAISVIDATAGWGSDALHLAANGFQVTAVEQNALVMAMLQHARERIESEGIKEKLALVHQNSVDYLDSLDSKVDVVYLDPMYPQKEKSAAPKKRLQVLQKLVGHSNDEKALLNMALRKAQQRVVVKRPHYADPVASGKVGEIRTKLVRFDIYKPLD